MREQVADIGNSGEVARRPQAKRERGGDEDA
jgi:hypothetical protein